MKKNNRILITGALGFIGASLSEFFSKKGYEVWGIDKQNFPEKNILAADLLSHNSTCLAFEKIPPCQIIIHTAALAHSEQVDKANKSFKINSIITENIVRSVKNMGEQPHFIFLSSVAVYGEDRHKNSVKVSEKLRPSTEYGKSKVYCEELVQQSGMKKYHILRLAPVFDQNHLKDIEKRVYFPWQHKFKMRIIPPPQYSLCHLETLKELISKLMQNNVQHNYIINVSDQKPYDQRSLSEQFKGIDVPCPTILLMPLYYFTFIFPKKTGYALRCLFWKLFKNNLFV